jgi:hypothetical protein
MPAESATVEDEILARARVEPKMAISSRKADEILADIEE